MIHLKKVLAIILLLLTAAFSGCSHIPAENTQPFSVEETSFAEAPFTTEEAFTEETSTEEASSEEASVEESSAEPDSTDAAKIPSAEESSAAPVSDAPSVNPDAPMIALTFDDGPYGNSTNRILDLLETNHARATFFMIGRNVVKFPDAISRMEELNCQLGNHTYNHVDLSKLSAEEMKEQVEKVNDAITEAGGTPAGLLRPPYGNSSATMKEQLGCPMILWTIDTRDWSSKDPEDIKSKVLDHVQDGDIVLMHDVYETTADACEVIIPELINRGFQLVTVEELMEAKGIQMQNGVIYQKPGKEGGF